MTQHDENPISPAEAERRRKISEAKKGKKRPTLDEMSPEARIREIARRAAISASKRGKKRPDLAERNRSEEARQRPRNPSIETRQRMSEQRTTHGGSRSRITGRKATPTYYVWAAMIQRCTNPKNRDWASYGGRGITVDTRWRDFKEFLADMGEKPDGLTLDRIDNNGDYGPSNCRWTTTKIQANNKRNSVNLSQADIDWTRSGSRTRTEIASALGISLSTVGHIINRTGKYADPS